jgi:hypothetical protein
MRFTVKLGGEIIGFSEISAVDPSMGCAYGRFIPTPAYRAIQKYCISVRDCWEPPANLTVEEPGGVTVECAGEFQIVDFSPELGDEGIEVHFLGITKPRYAELFPDDFKTHGTS